MRKTLEQMCNEYRYTTNTPMPFGRHKGKKMRHVPIPYLLWLIEQPFVRKSYPSLYRYLLNHKVVASQYTLWHLRDDEHPSWHHDEFC